MGAAGKPAPAPDLLAAADEVVVRLDGHVVLENVTLAVHEGEIVTLIGPNGSGKTTLVRALLGLISPEGGAVYRRPGLRVGYMPQRLAVDETLPLTVARFLALSESSRPLWRGGSGAALRHRIATALAEAGALGLVERPLCRLSTGELQRVLLARALARAPDLLVLDEPVQGVDVTGQAELYALIARIRDRRGCGVLMVSHDLHLVMAATDTVVCLNRHVCCTGRPEAVSRDPAYLALFGPAAREIAVYAHVHDHRHDPAGAVVAGPGAQAADTAAKGGEPARHHEKSHG